MKITNVEPIIVAAPLDEPWKIGTAIFRTMTATLVRVETDEGISGIGECLTRFAPEAAAAIVEKILKPVVVGQDPFEIELIWEKMYGVMRGRGHSKGFTIEAMSGVDIALWDVMGKALGQPIHRLLGSYGRTTLPVYASSLLFKPTAVLVAEAEQLAACGYTGIKLKIGQGDKTDMTNVREIRRAVGDNVKLMTDANCAFDTHSAMLLGRQLQDEGVYWFEEPVAPENLDGYSKLAHALDMAIAGGESEFTRWAFKDLMAREAIDIIQPDLGRCGGFTEARKIAAVASAFDVPVAPHTGASSAVSIAAAIQWAAALPNMLTFEYMYPPNPLREQLLLEPLPAVEKSCLRVLQNPGLGVELDPKALARFKQN